MLFTGLRTQSKRSPLIRLCCENWTNSCREIVAINKKHHKPLTTTLNHYREVKKHPQKRQNHNNMKQFSLSARDVANVFVLPHTFLKNDSLHAARFLFWSPRTQKGFLCQGITPGCPNYSHMGPHQPRHTVAPLCSTLNGGTCVTSNCLCTLILTGMEKKFFLNAHPLWR